MEKTAENNLLRELVISGFAGSWLETECDAKVIDQFVLQELLRELVGSKQAVVEKTAENKLLRELVDSKQAVVDSKQAVVEKTEEQQDSTARELLHTVARHRAVIVHRVLLDSCLRGGCSYDAKQTFTQRYQQFRTREVLGEDGLFTIVADCIMQEILGRYQVKATDVNKELDGLPRQSSKPFHLYL